VSIDCHEILIGILFVVLLIEMDYLIQNVIENDYDHLMIDYFQSDYDF
jgi:hypothetical protein